MIATPEILATGQFYTGTLIGEPKPHPASWPEGDEAYQKALAERRESNVSNLEPIPDG